ncbi:RNA 3'-terminal phosphate cyclase [Methylocystis heyeri]|uniref:RNA 3'-terminal phosphate cyclase n=1 Tax=Methylocystis heyeri TaxID=391905 RepID=A0A6B8KBD1_9HYPH|nr:RNA 3'-terminal phosphate cyclase [Methylocystis heyeri]QGM44321.1 RNA 3'-terminal phosphate cyclase [Methylocystis heyeri]
MLTIDGAFGEGGGQILRSALSLSMATGQPFAIERIRAGRERPGLMRQHLTAVKAAAEICGARIDGAEVGSTSLVFAPGPVRAGDYVFNIGSAGSTSLVLQTVLLPLALAGAPSRVTIQGGTNNVGAPPFEFLDRAFLPLLRRMGYSVAAALTRPGYYPAGGGEIVIEIGATSPTRPLLLTTRGALIEHKGEAVVSNLAYTIATREAERLCALLNWSEDRVAPMTERRAKGPGNILIVTLGYEHVTEVFVAFGRLGASSETVAEECAAQVDHYLRGEHPVDVHLGDQLLLPLALGPGGVFVTCAPSRHMLTNIEVIHAFLGEKIAIRELPEGVWRIEIGGVGADSE